MSPAPVAGETLYSWASRRNILYGYSAAHHTCLDLFGHKRLGAQHDFGRRLNEFAARTHSVLGDAQTIIAERTLYPFYRPFRTNEEDVDLTQRMCDGLLGAAKVSLGLVTSRFRANHPLKACPRCMDEDRMERGFTHWRVAHQYPGVWWCIQHDHPLQEFAIKSNGAGHYGWWLPTREWLLPAPPLHEHQHGAERARQFASACTDAATASAGFRVDYQRLPATYRSGLAKHTPFLDGRYPRWKEIARSYVDFVRPLRCITELAAFPSEPSLAQLHLRAALGAARDRSHPLRHISLICWAHGDWAAFRETHQQMITAGTAAGTMSDAPQAVITSSAIDVTKQALLNLLRSEGIPLTHAADRLNVNFIKAFEWARDAGIAVQRQPYVLVGEAHAQAIAMLREGVSTSDIARAVGVSTGTIAHLRRTEAGVYETWTAVRYEKAFAAARRD